MWAEKDALWVNRQGRIQRGQRAVLPPGDAREDWRVLVDLLQHVGQDPELAGLPALRRLVAADLVDGWMDENVLNRCPSGMAAAWRARGRGRTVMLAVTIEAAPRSASCSR